MRLHILPGTNCSENGITSNQSARLSSEKNISNLCLENNLKTGAAAYYWVSEGYDIIVSADHGMDSLGLHNGTSEKERKVPLFVVNDALKPGYHDEEMSQLLIAPLICKLLGIEKSKKMRSFDPSILVEGGNGYK